jgi:hypothetical protein
MYKKFSPSGISRFLPIIIQSDMKNFLVEKFRGSREGNTEEKISKLEKFFNTCSRPQKNFLIFFTDRGYNLTHNYERIIPLSLFNKKI